MMTGLEAIAAASWRTLPSNLKTAPFSNCWRESSIVDLEFCNSCLDGGDPQNIDPQQNGRRFTLCFILLAVLRILLVGRMVFGVIPELLLNIESMSENIMRIGCCRLFAGLCSTQQTCLTIATLKFLISSLGYEFWLRQRNLVTS